ncbi:unnamed protein product [Spirodela intermedia]|uniref:Uncharacterized protein n=1 Tax=Spirodela intermedia TaxID=51605 RepID=A0A7I8ILN1_SPIIN|nr:unnamed protein product [Spirodela intermedia]CAA6658072.1 unnamed protein product [Spirodela intermedia]
MLITWNELSFGICSVLSTLEYILKCSSYFLHELISLL